MPCGPRLDAPGVLHHAMARGIERRPAAHARAVACGLAVQRLGLPVAEVARAQGISPTAVRLGLPRADALMRKGGVKPEDLVTSGITALRLSTMC